MYDQNTCFIKAPPESFDLSNWQHLVNMMANLYGSACGVVVQHLNGEFTVVSTSTNAENFLEVNQKWPWDMRSFCRRIVETNERLYVGNPKDDHYWADSPPVAEGPVRSYLGYPLYWPDGTLFGSFCVIDDKPTDYPENLIETLGQLKLIIEADLKHITDFYRIAELLDEKQVVKEDLASEQQRLSQIQQQLSGFELINSVTLDALTESVIRIDENAQILAVNYAVENMFGYAGDELIGKNVKMLMPKRLSEKHDDFLNRYLQTGVTKVIDNETRVMAMKKNGQEFPVQLSVSEIYFGTERQFIGLLTDITEKVNYEEHLKSLALYDPLTGCANRNLLQERFMHIAAIAKRNGTGFSIAYIDLNKFKPINDTYGHLCGDFVLKKVTHRIKQQIRTTDLLARTGGDEFVVVFTDKSPPCEIQQKIKRAVRQKIEFEGRLIHVSCSVGMAHFPCDGNSLESLLLAGDKRMYEDKTMENSCE